MSRCASSVSVFAGRASRPVDASDVFRVAVAGVCLLSFWGAFAGGGPDSSGMTPVTVVRTRNSVLFRTEPGAAFLHGKGATWKKTTIKITLKPTLPMPG